jgi:pyruvate dehydrogenase E1 component beta subunit
MNLVAPVVRVAGYDTPMPLARLEDFYLPSVERILGAAEKVLSYR